MNWNSLNSIKKIDDEGIISGAGINLIDYNAGLLKARHRSDLMDGRIHLGVFIHPMECWLKRVMETDDDETAKCPKHGKPQQPETDPKLVFFPFFFIVNIHILLLFCLLLETE